MSIVVNKTRLPVTEWQTTSGSVVSVNDARKRYAKSLSVALEPIQDLHGYDHPWVGGAGVNAMPNAVAKTETQNGITISTNGDGIYRFSGTALSDAIIVFPLSVSFTIPSGNADTGTHSAFFMNTDINSTNVTVCFMNGSVQVDSWAMTPKNRVATAYNAMSNKVCDGIKFIIRSGMSVSGTISPMFVAKGTPTNTPFSTYENICPISGRSSVTAYRAGANQSDNPTSVTLSLGQTVYGGIVDLVSGVMRVTNGIYTCTGNETGWNKSSSYPASFYRSWGMFGSTKTHSPFICSHALYNGNFNTYKFGQCYSNTTCSLWIQNDTSMTVNGFKALLADYYNNGNPVQVCYELATPLTIQLSPNQIEMLMRNNTIWSDAGQVTLEYARIHQ